MEDEESHVTRITGWVLRSNWEKAMASTAVRNMGLKSDLNPSSSSWQLYDLEQGT